LEYDDAEQFVGKWSLDVFAGFWLGDGTGRKYFARSAKWITDIKSQRWTLSGMSESDQEPSETKARLIRGAQLHTEELDILEVLISTREDDIPDGFLDQGSVNDLFSWSPSPYS
jgi:hypothetical protein